MRLVRVVWFLVKRAAMEWSEINASRFGAALAYYSVFAIAPSLLIVISVAGLLLGKEAAEKKVVREIEGTTGPAVAKAIQQMLADNAGTHQNTIAVLTGLVVVLVGAVGVFRELQDALNAIWKVAPKPESTWRDLLRDRLISLTMVLGTAFLLLVSLVIHAVLSGMSTMLRDHLAGGEELWQAINAAVSFSVASVLFGLIFKFVPDARISLRDVWIGAILTAALFTLGKFLLGWYLGRASTTSAYGAAASAVVVLLWVYYASQILLFGAAFTRAYTLWLGAGAEPSPHALSTASAGKSATR